MIIGEDCKITAYSLNLVDNEAILHLVNYGSHPFLLQNSKLGLKERLLNKSGDTTGDLDSHTNRQAGDKITHGSDTQLNNHSGSKSGDQNSYQSKTHMETKNTKENEKETINKEAKNTKEMSR